MLYILSELQHRTAIGSFLVCHLFAQDRAFILKAMNRAVSHLYVQDDTSEQAA